MYLSTSIGSPSQTIGGNHPNPPSFGSNTTFVFFFFFFFPFFQFCVHLVRRRAPTGRARSCAYSETVCGTVSRAL